MTRLLSTHFYSVLTICTGPHKWLNPQIKDLWRQPIFSGVFLTLSRVGMYSALLLLSQMD